MPVVDEGPGPGEFEGTIHCQEPVPPYPSATFNTASWGVAMVPVSPIQPPKTTTCFPSDDRTAVCPERGWIDVDTVVCGIDT
jgi:hypothetical protein